MSRPSGTGPRGGRPARVIAFGASNVAPAGAVVGGLVLVVSYAGFASPLVVLIAFAASLCCASSIAEFARRLPSAGSLYTYNSRGAGPDRRLPDRLDDDLRLRPVRARWHRADQRVRVSAAGWHGGLDGAGLGAVPGHPGRRRAGRLPGHQHLILRSTWCWSAGEVAVITALAITVLVKAGPAHYSAAVLSPASSPHGQVTDITQAMIYGITAFAGFEAAAALGEEARRSRRSIPVATFGVVAVTGIFFLLVVVAEMFGVGRAGMPGLLRDRNPLGYLTSHYWSPSALWIIQVVVVLTGLSFVVAALQRQHPGAVRHGPGTSHSRPIRPAVQPPYPGRGHRLCGRAGAAARAAADVPDRRGTGVRLSGWCWWAGRGARLPRAEHRDHPGVPHRVPGRVPARPAPAGARGGQSSRSRSRCGGCCTRTG